MLGRMDDQNSRQALRALTDVLDASVRDIATGNVCDAAAVQHEAKRMLAEFEIARSGAGSALCGNSGRRPKTA